MRYWDPILVGNCNRQEMKNTYNTTSQQINVKFT